MEIVKNHIRIKSMTEADNRPTVIIDYPNERPLGQLTTKTEYVILDGNNYKTTHKPFFCKDYFNEILATEYDNKSRIQYGFKSEKLEFNILDTKTFKLALINKSSVDINQYIEGLLLLLNQADKNRDFELTTIEETTDKHIIVLTVDTNWLKVPAYLSFYTLLIRLAYNYKGEDFNQYITTIFPKIDSSVKISSGDSMIYKGSETLMLYLFEGGKLLQKWEDYLDVSNDRLHNYSGMNNYFRNKYKSDINKLKEDVEQNTKETVIEV